MSIPTEKLKAIVAAMKHTYPPHNAYVKDQIYALAADPESGMKALAEELLRIRREVAEMEHEASCDSLVKCPACSVNAEICRICNGYIPACNCIKSRIGEVKA